MHHTYYEPNLLTVYQVTTYHLALEDAELLTMQLLTMNQLTSHHLALEDAVELPPARDNDGRDLYLESQCIPRVSTTR